MKPHPICLSSTDVTYTILVVVKSTVQSYSNFSNLESEYEIIGYLLYTSMLQRNSKNSSKMFYLMWTHWYG